MTTCETTDFVYPLIADVYYPIVETGAYGNIKKTWVLDRGIACFFNPAGSKNKQDVDTEANINIDSSFLGRTKADVTMSQNSSSYSLTNIILTNIRGSDGKSIYNESAGARSGKPTLFEVSTFSPVVGPFGTVDFYKIMIRRSENQAVDL